MVQILYRSRKLSLEDTEVKNKNAPSENISHCSDLYVDIMKVAANNMTGKTKTMGVTKWL